MKLSWGITACTEVEELKQLLNTLCEHIGVNTSETGDLFLADEIIILVDTSKHTKEISDQFTMLQLDFPDPAIKWYFDKFEGHFADWKNKLNSYCSGDFICQLDADEIPTVEFVKHLVKVLEVNPEIELYTVPRENKVEGITMQDIQKWGWRIDSEGVINWPDLQGRVYRNSPGIRWEGKVHERIVGNTTMGSFYGTALDRKFYLKHYKTIKKQREQNNLYNSMV